MKVTISEVTPEWLPNRMAEMTTHGRDIKANSKVWFKSEHSPIRGLLYWIELLDIPTFVSVHLVRHKIGVEHFVKSKRDDLRPDINEKVDRDTPINHGMLINAQSLINLSKKRLCYKSHKKTVAVMQRIKKTVPKEIQPYLVPECVYRNGICPEIKECKPGLDAVLLAYENYPLRN